jgi:hypothetical protein
VILYQHQFFVKNDSRGQISMAELRFSQMSTARQVLIRACQQVGFGAIRNLELRGQEPHFGPDAEIVFDYKLDGDEVPRPERSLNDFVICSEILRLFSMLDRMGNGTIEHVEVRAGIPRRMRFKAAKPTQQ